MSEPRREAAACVEDLQSSAPLRDFARASDAVRRSAACALPSPQAATDVPVACVALALLLSAHARRTRVSFAVARPLAPAAIVSLELTPEGTVAAHAAEVARQLADPAVPVWPPSQPLPGVLLNPDPSAQASAVPAADLTLHLGPTPQFVADATLYRPDSLPPLARHFARLADAATASPAQRVGDLPLVDAAERHRVLHEFNALRVPFPHGNQTFATLIEAQCRQRPLAVCATHRDAALTYAELDARASRLAALLVQLGTGPGSFVAIVDRRGLDFVVAMLAIWKAGGAYVPVDPGYPEERVRYMLADCEAEVALFGADALRRYGTALADCPRLAHAVLLQEGDAHATVRLHSPAAYEALAPLPPGARCTPSDPAYMVYTSGSTGRPKGAIVRHDGALNHVFAQAHALGAESVSRFLQSAPASSDISVWQLAAPLVLGGTTAIADDATDVANLLAQVQRHGLHIVELVPVVMKYLVEYAMALPAEERAVPSLRWAMVTGESASAALVNAWLAAWPQVPVVNAYGPTEAADDIAQAVIREPLPPGQLTVPIGRPLANLDLYVLDDALRPLPVGAPGELCVAGIGVGAGYWRQPDKTAAAFVPNPFADEPGAAGPVIYRTGDLGRWRDDGTLECLGRLDHQVQLRGQRIELPEIEAVLREHPAVSDAVAQVFHDGQGDGLLAAWAVPRGQATPDEAALRRHLAARLPGHMVPASITVVAALPLNPAGKVDRNALKPPSRPAARQAGADSGEPLSPLEALLARLFAEEIGCGAVGRHDDFFALGGDSLAALAISVAAREAGWRLRSADVLAHPTVAALARVAVPANAGAGHPQAAARPVAQPAMQPLPEARRREFLAREPQWEDVRALTPPEQAIYLHWLLSRDKSAYVDQVCHEIEGPLSAAALEAAWNAVIARHPALRGAVLRSALGQPALATAREAAIAIEFEDASRLPPDEQDRAWARRLQAELARGADPTRAPPMRVCLQRLAPERHRMAWTHHHIAVDGWSVSLVLEDLLAAHAALSRAQEWSAAPPSVAPYLAFLANFDTGPALQHWQHALAGHPGERPWRDAPPATPEPGFGEEETALGTAALRARAASACVTLGTLLQAAWAVLLARHTGRADTLFGVVTTGRELPVPGIGAMAGLFVTTLPLRVNAQREEAQPEGLALHAWLQAVQYTAAEARQHEAVPLAHVTRQAGLPPGTALFDTLLVMSNYPAPRSVPGALLQLRPVGFRTAPAYALSLVVLPGESLVLRLVHQRSRFSAEATRALLRELAELLHELAAGHDPRNAAP